jgi:hypothetical protein
MKKLTVNNIYSREEVKNILDPHATYTPGAGTWGIHGVINIKQEYKRFVFFVTYGSKQGAHAFDEGISKDGLVKWQSQPSQHLKEERIVRWVGQKDNGCDIHLFVRNNKKKPFIYIGEIDYLDHNKELERPVWFTFKVKNWFYSPEIHPNINPLKNNGAGLPTRPSDNYGQKKNAVGSVAIESLIRRHSTELTLDGSETLRFDYETSTGTTIPLVIEGPGREKYVIGLADHDHDSLLFVSVAHIIKMSVDLAIEAQEPLTSENIKCFLFLKAGNYPVTERTATKYGVHLIFVDSNVNFNSIN